MPVDRLGAFSKGSRLGTLLWRLKYGQDPKCYKPAVLLLAKEMSLQSHIGTRLCEMAVHEWLLPHCPTCQGARELIIGPKRIVCLECDGYGVKRYSDQERDNFLGSRFKPWGRKYGRVQSRLTGEDRAINPKMIEELERT